MTITLRELLHGVTAQPVAAVPISGIACHSKQVRPGDLFVAIQGSTQDGHLFIEEAMSRRACAVVAQHLPSSGHPCPCVVVPDTRQALATIAARFYGHPSSKLRLVGVTGTNGKTTTTYLLQAILEASGVRAGLLGTIMYHIGGRAIPSTNTTPGPLELQRYFAQMVGEGLAWCAMEVSSHALAQGRVAGLEFEAGIFTNLGSDHLDYHKTRDAYAAAKRRLFDVVRPDGCAVINADDEYGRTLAETIPTRTVVTYGMERQGDASVKHVVCSWQGTSFVLDTPWGVAPVATPLLGRHNVWNIAAAATTLLALGIPVTAVRDGLSAIEQVPGRLERVPSESGVNVLIDYAHTADALRLTLLSLRELNRGRLIVVFGCGGDRDHMKRPVMGRIASLIADHVVLTSDNPRTEEPLDIIHQIKAGFTHGFRQFQVMPDREQAIASVLAEAKAEDTILIAGKGHEAYQIFDHVSIPFSDRDVVERCLSSRHSFAVS
ncbi:MAG: UDP-N-acetylmuramoyl-L-alanyl-D-glutamate--2,6-diaminopimelate ligase [Candidatus Omnitrophica bacterium]|nr:UDP-N-acetylmuramoyl-L-alanyl-D-glutamate--2,6-diaminopimelate ligase [Candidatus Omnitrophota bacterium]